MEKTGNVNHNHCVKADPQDPLPFCYTTDPNVRYEHCDCDDNQMGFNYPDYNYQTVYNGKSNGYYYNPRAGQQGRCRVSRTISGIVMIGSNSEP